MIDFKKGMWVVVTWGGKGDEHPALVVEVRDSILDVIDLGVNQVLGVPFDWATPMDLPRICNDDGQPVDLIGAECLGTGEMQGMEKWPENVTPAVSDEDIQVRRFITECEDS